MKKGLILALIVIVLIVGGKCFLSCQNSDQSNPYSSLGGDFEIQGVAGETKLSSLKGKVVVLYIGFTHCPDICPTSLTTMARAFSSLDAKVSEQAQAVFFSVDYQRDDANVADEYIKYYIKSGIGFSGNQKQVDKLVEGYGAYYKMVSSSEDSDDSGLEFTIDHTSRFYVLDKNGNLVASILDGEGFEKLKIEIEKAVKL